jgi:glycosyltransferase involved in cell wall biosynthesis
LGHPLHVLYVIDSLAPGGSERSLAAMVPRFTAAGLSLDVAYLRERPGVHEELLAGGARLFPPESGGGRIAAARRLGTLIRDRGPDLVHTTLFESDLSGRIGSLIGHVPVVSTLAASAYDEEHLSDPSLRRWKVRFAQVADASTAQLVTRFHAVASHVADDMARRLWVPRGRIDVVPRGRDPEALGVPSEARRAHVRGSLGIEPAERVVLAVARHEHKKGLDVLIRAMPSVVRTIPSARLLIAGREGTTTGPITRLVRDLAMETKVTLLGHRRDVPELLCAADIFVLPSRSEGSPGAMLEAMALGVPIVATDIPPVWELVGRDRLTQLLEPGDHGSLAEAISTVLADPMESRRIGEAGRARFFEHFTIDRVVERMIRFYERSISVATVRRRRRV